MVSGDILIVDDEADIRMQLRGLLQDEGYTTREAHHAESAFAAIQTKQPDLVLLDIWLEGSKLDGMGILDKISETYPDVPVIMISGHGNIEMAVNAIKKGAYDFIEKPFKTDHFLHLCQRALETSKLRRENTELKRINLGPTSLHGQSAAISQVMQSVNRAAPTNSRVMILGEGGTGKGIVARLIHERSEYSTGNFVSFNCALLEDSGFDEALFGVEDARTGKVLKKGALERAQGGTLFLDEVSYLSSNSQLKILRILQNMKYTRINGKNELKLNARIISASHQRIEKDMSKGSFKQDLFYRLNVVPILMPALRDRVEDIGELSTLFMKELASQYGRQPLIIGQDVMNIMQSYHWPGNVRQLRNVIESFLIMADPQSDQVLKDFIPPELRPDYKYHNQTGGGANDLASSIASSDLMALPLRQARECFEREYLSAQVKRFGGNISKTASFIGMERSALHRKLKNLGLNGENEDESDTNAPRDEVRQSA